MSKATATLVGLESRILHETANLYLWQNTNDTLDLRLHAGTHSVCVGHPRDLEHGKCVMERLERGIHELKQMYGVL